MEARATPPRTPKFWVAIQPTIVRLYKVAGLVALTAILVGLVGFLVVNIFYFFDKSWVRPVVLSPTHQKVVESSTLLADAKLRASELVSSKVEIEANLAEIDRTIKHDELFISEVGTIADAPKTADQWLVHRTLAQAKLEKENALGRRAPLQQRLESVRLRIEEQDKVVARLSQSPYLKAIDSRVVLAFVPYQNLRNVQLNTKLYGCSWGLIACKKVGHVTAILDGEVTDIHPHDESVQRGVMVEITVKSHANDKVLFAGGKPLWLF